MTDWLVRDERPGESPAVAALIEAAFRDAPHRDGNESSIPECLREAGELTLSLVAVTGPTPIGHVAFSPVSITDRATGWYGLGPIAVRPDFQGQGVGSALVRAGLARLRESGAGGCVVLGEPHHYRRLGFRLEPRLRYLSAPADYFMALPFGDGVPEGEVTYPPAFN